VLWILRHVKSKSTDMSIWFLQKWSHDESEKNNNNMIQHKASCLDMRFIVFIKVMLFGKQSLCRCSALPHAFFALLEAANRSCVVQRSRVRSSALGPLRILMSGVSFFSSIDISISRVVSDVVCLPVHLELILHLRVEVRRVVGLVTCITKSLAFHPSPFHHLQRKTHH
jgi:hypothetical protein